MTDRVERKVPVQSGESAEGAYEQFLDQLYPTPEAKREFRRRVDAVNAAVDGQDAE